MKIWKWKTDANNYDFFILPNKEDVKRLNDLAFDGKQLSHLWTPISVDIEEEISTKSDTPTFNFGPVLSVKALDALKYLIEKNTEILPMKFREETYYLINVTKVLDCIDYQNAQFIPFESTGRPMIFTKYAFKEELVKDEHIFKIIEHAKAYVLVSDEFRNRALASGLVGFRFEELWDSEK